MIKKTRNYKKLFPLNFKYFKKNKGILISDRIQIDANLRTIFFAEVLNKKDKFNLFLVSDLNNKKNIPVYGNFNIEKFSINIQFKDLKYLIIFFHSFFDTLLFYVKTIFHNNKIKWLIDNFKCKEVKIGDLIYDYYIRYDLKFLDPSIYNYNFIKILFNGILKTRFIDFIVKKKKIKILISNQVSYTSYGNIMLRYGGKYKLKTFLTGRNFFLRLKNHKETLTSPFKIKEKTINENIKKISNKKIINFYNLRNNGKLYGTYVPVNTMKKIYGVKEDKKNLNFLKKLNRINKTHQINLLAVHCFSDSPHLCGDMIFRDYYDQFMQTINFIRNDKKNFWIVKPHPARSEYNEDGIIEDIINRYKNELDNVEICPENLNNSTIFQLSDNLINGVSTISIEFACHGKKSIIAGDAPFFNKNLFLKPKTKHEYFTLIKNLKKLNTRLGTKDIMLAKRILYILEELTFNNLKTSKILPNFDDNILEEKNYFKYINNKFKNIKNLSIYNDPFYKDLKLKLSSQI